MKKSLLITLVFGISLFISSMAFAVPNHGDDGDCIGLDGEAAEICDSYCFSKACATDDPAGNPKSCAVLKDNFMKVTGTDVLPCDIVACGVCAALNEAGNGSVGICEEIKSIDCDDDGLENYGENPCSAVTLPLPGGAPACDNTQPGPFGTFIPDCQYVGGLAWVCTRFLGGTPIDGACPSPPWCTEEQMENLNMPPM